MSLYFERFILNNWSPKIQLPLKSHSNRTCLILQGLGLCVLKTIALVPHTRSATTDNCLAGVFIGKSQEEANLTHIGPKLLFVSWKVSLMPPAPSTNFTIIVGGRSSWTNPSASFEYIFPLIRNQTVPLF